MSNCRYCMNMVCNPENETRATWEPVQWRCEKGWALIDGEHGCPDFEREPGADDDMGEPSPYLPPLENG